MAGIDRRGMIAGLPAVLVMSGWSRETKAVDAVLPGSKEIDAGLVRGLVPGVYTQRVVLEDGREVDLPSRTVHADHLWLDLPRGEGAIAQIEVVRTGSLAAPFDRPPTPLELGRPVTRRVSSASELGAALSSAQGGEVIAIDADILEPVRITRAVADFAEAVEIRGGDPTRPATIASLEARGAHGLRFARLRASGAPGRNKPLWRFDQCEDLEIEQCRFEGQSEDMRSTPPMGLMVRNGRGIRILYNYFERLENGVAFFNVDDLHLVRNRFARMRYDFMRGGGLVGGTIDGNVGAFVEADRQGGGHPDFVQLWTSPPVARATRDLEIRNNLFWIGTEGFDRAEQFGTHFIFVTEQNSEKRELEPHPYERVRIYNNLCTSNSPQGVWMGRGSGGYIANNLCLGSGPVSVEGWGHVRIWAQTGAVCANNVAFDFRLKGEERVLMRNNLTLRRDLAPVRALIAELAQAALAGRRPQLDVPAGPLGGLQDAGLPGLGPALDAPGFPADDVWMRAG